MSIHNVMFEVHFNVVYVPCLLNCIAEERW